MDRRESLKLLALAAVAQVRLPRALGAQEPLFASRWQEWPDVRWAGPEYWANRLQDWAIEGGVLVCRTQAANRTLHCLTHRCDTPGFRTTVDLDPVHLAEVGGPQSRAGFRVGVTGRFDEYRSAAVHGTGLDVGVDGDGALFLGEEKSDERIDLSEPLRLTLGAMEERGGLRLTLLAASLEGGAELGRITRDVPEAEVLVGGLALLSDFSNDPTLATETPNAAVFSGWTIDGDGIAVDSARAFGPIMFAQYTAHRSTLKLTAQLAPVDDVVGLRATLEIRDGRGPWVEAATAPIDALSRTARFRVDGWDASRPVAYRVRLLAPPSVRWGDFDYVGTIAAEPSTAQPLKAAVFSCNADHGFPDGEVVRNVSVHDPDLCLFLGDQFYEGSGGFGVQTDSIEEAALDMLHKWYMFGWSYRELFRHVPAAFIPDDHDVYHGNVWGEGGKAAPTHDGWGAVAQDQGGYKMPAEWVRAVERAQTSHLPDPVDPAPVKQGIGVYFTKWDYAGVSFAILEDRKFKSAPANVLPPEAQVLNGWIQNPDFDVREHRDLPNAELLGDRQMRFLESWAADW
ncbi:MAG: alkaline phosphatase D, partial [Myxococcota bacterium]